MLTEENKTVPSVASRGTSCQTLLHSVSADLRNRNAAFFPGGQIKDDAYISYSSEVMAGLIPPTWGRFAPNDV